MSLSRPLILASAALLLVAACAPPAAPPPDTTADVAAIKKAQDREVTSLIAANIDSMMANYTADVVFMPPDEPMVSGGQAGRAWLEAFVKESSVSGKYTSAEVEVAGTTGIVRYTGELTTTPKKGGKSAVFLMKGVHIFKKQTDGSWKIAQDVWNFDPAPAPAKK